MKYYIFSNYENTWRAEYRSAGMKNSDNETVVGIKSSRIIDNKWVDNNIDIDIQMISLGLPTLLGHRFTEVEFVKLAEDKNINLLKVYEREDAIPLNVALNSEALIQSFVLTEQTGNAVIDNEAGTIEIIVNYGTVVSDLAPVITLSDGATVSPESGVGTDFTNPVTYTVTAENGEDTKEYTVTVAVADPSTEALLLSFVLAEQTGDAIIDNDLGTVSIEVANGTVVTALQPTITISNNATISPLSGAATDFTNPVTYTVTAEDEITTKEYVVTVTVAAP